MKNKLLVKHLLFAALIVTTLFLIVRTINENTNSKSFELSKEQSISKSRTLPVNDTSKKDSSNIIKPNRQTFPNNTVTISVDDFIAADNVEFKSRSNEIIHIGKFIDADNVELKSPSNEINHIGKFIDADKSQLKIPSKGNENIGKFIDTDSIRLTHRSKAMIHIGNIIDSEAFIKNTNKR